jgi:hypothetical protein
MTDMYADSNAHATPAAVKNKVENRSQYDEYLVELKALREQYGIPLKEDMYPDDSKNWKSMS